MDNKTISQHIKPYTLPSRTSRCTTKTWQRVWLPHADNNTEGKPAENNGYARREIVLRLIDYGYEK